MKKILLKTIKNKWLLAILLAAPLLSFAQLTGVKGIGSLPSDSYTSVELAIAALNTQGVGGGGVTFNISANYANLSESPSAPLAITATGTNANPIKFVNASGGTYTIIAPSGGTATPTTTTAQNGIWNLQGSDFVTIDGFTLKDNNSGNASMEYGFALYKASASNGAQNNLIQNCTITLDRNNNTAGTAPFADGSVGIAVVNALVSAPTTALSSTTSPGGNANNGFYKNTIQNCNVGIALIGCTTNVSPYIGSDSGNGIGNPSVSTSGNIIQNFGNGGVSSPAAGIVTLAQYNSYIVNNTINNIAGSGIAHHSALYGIRNNAAAGASFNIVQNTISLTSGATSSPLTAIENSAGSGGASNLISISNNVIKNCSYLTSTTGSFTGISNTANPATVDMAGNNIFSNAITSTSSGDFTAVSNTGSPSTLNITSTNIYSNTASLSTGDFMGISNTGSSTVANINGNQVGVSASGNTVTSTSGTFTGISNSGNPTFFTIGTVGANNSVLNNTLSGTGLLVGINAGDSQTLSLNNNNISNNAKTGSGGFYCIITGVSAVNCANNTLTNNTFSNSTGGTTALLVGFVNATSPTSETYDSNTISGLTVTASSTVTGNIYGIYANSAVNTATISNNKINGLNFTTTGTGSATVNAIYRQGASATVNISKNEIRNLSADGAVGLAEGISLNNGTTWNISNNLIGDLKSPSSGQGVFGILISGNSTINAYYNTIHLNATSTGANFGSADILAQNTATLNLRNNIFVNNSTNNGTGITVAFQRTGGVDKTKYAATSNTNLFYAGTGSGHFIFNDGTNQSSNLASFKSVFTTGNGGQNQDQASVTENPPFLATSGTTNFLHINTSTPTLVEGNGLPISGYADDYDAVGSRNGSTPDIGADEGNFTAIDNNGPVISYTALSDSPSGTSVTLTATISDASGVSTTTGPTGGMPVLYYKINNAASYTAVQGANPAGNTFTFTFNPATSGVTGTDQVKYYVVAQDLVATPNVSVYTSAGQDIVSTGLNSNPPITNNYAGTPDVYTSTGTMSGLYTVGSGKFYPSLTAAVTQLNQRKIVGAVTFDLYAPAQTETYPIVINANVGSSATNTVTIKPASANVLTFTSTNTTASSLIQLNGVDYVTINGSNSGSNSQDLTFVGGNSNTSGMIWISSNAGNAATNNTVKNCVITGKSNITNYGIVSSDNSSINAIPVVANNNTTIQNNLISTCLYGIYTKGNATTKNTGTNITLNSMGQGAPANVSNGIAVFNEDGVQITKNVIKNIVNSTNSFDNIAINAGFPSGIVTNSTAVSGFEVINAVITGNTIDNVVNSNSYSASGIAYASVPSGTSTIANNMIAGVNSNGTSPDFASGIFLGGTTGVTGAAVKVYYNSVAMVGAHGTVTAPNFALAINGSDPNVDVRNNILYNTSTATNQSAILRSTAIGLGYAAPFANLTLNNNIYYVTAGNTGFAVGSINSLTSAAAVPSQTLAAWKTNSGKDAVSVSFLPEFFQVTPGFQANLHLNPAVKDINYAGAAIAGVDFDDQARPASSPYIGADEVTTLALPLDLVSFSGKASEHANHLAWSTANESNTSHFDVERMVNGVDFVKINVVAAAGDSKKVLDYSFTDNNLVSSVNTYYYRLKMVDQNGDFTYSKIVDVSGALKSTFDAFVSPNPSNGSVAVSILNPDKENASVDVFNLSGKKVANVQITNQDAFYTQTCDWSNLPKGVYVVKVSTASNVKTMKMIIE